MKIRFTRMISILCAVMLLISAVSVWAAAEDVNTPTDLPPVEEEKTAEPEEPKDEGITSVEIVITKTLTINQSWEGKMSKTKPAVLKLDLATAGRVNMVIDGKDVWATVQKADRLTENPPRIQTDSETGMLTYGWEAEAGSYLITLGPVEPNLLARATVSFMDNQAFQTWQAEQEKANAEPEPEQDPEPEPEPEKEPEPETEPAKELEPEEEPSNEPENKPEEEQPVENGPESENKPERHITVEVTFDVPNPAIGDTAHFKANLEGYEGLTYSMQWQYGPDKKTWHDIPGETNETMDVIVNETNNMYYWRILVYIEQDQES